MSFRELANSAIDISDGLIADLDHILELSHVGATLDAQAIPRFKQIKIDELKLFSGGDDYELCFTASKSNRYIIQQLADELKIKLSRIGVITEDLSYLLKNNELNQTFNLHDLNSKGFDHFQA